MKKIIAVFAVVLLIGSMVLVFSGCGEDDNSTTTTTSTTVPGTSGVTTTQNPGVVTDESEEGDNGVLGDIVTDVSEGVSDAITDVSEDVSRMIR